MIKGTQLVVFFLVGPVLANRRLSVIGIPALPKNLSYHPGGDVSNDQLTLGVILLYVGTHDIRPSHTMGIISSGMT